MGDQEDALLGGLLELYGSFNTNSRCLVERVITGRAVKQQQIDTGISSLHIQSTLVVASSHAEPAGRSEHTKVNPMLLQRRQKAVVALAVFKGHL